MTNPSLSFSQPKATGSARGTVCNQFGWVHLGRAATGLPGAILEGVSVREHKADKPVGLNLLIYPSNLVGASRVGKIARSIQDTGYFKETHMVGIRSGDFATSEKVAPGVRLVRVRGSARADALGGFLKVMIWLPRVYHFYRRQNVAAVAAQNVWVLPMAYLLSRRTGAALAYNAHELETEVAGAQGPKKLVSKLIERSFIHKQDLVSVVNEPIAAWYEREYKIERPIVVTNVPEDDGEQVDLRRLLDIPDGPLLYIHTGNLAAGRSIPLILKEFSSNPAVHMLFLGDGPLLDQVLAASQRSSNIHWLPPVAPSRVVSYVRGADVGLCLIEPGSLSRELSTPNKLMETLAAGRPVLSSDLLEPRRLLSGQSHAWLLEFPERDLGAALKRIDRAELETFNANSIEVRTWDQEVRPLVKAYKRAVTGVRAANVRRRR